MIQQDTLLPAAVYGVGMRSWEVVKVQHGSTYVRLYSIWKCWLEDVSWFSM